MYGAKEAAEKFAQACRETFGENLTGVYLHGSLAMGCYNPRKSDIDLLVVTETEPGGDEKRAFLEKVLRLDAAAPGKGLELSVVRRADCETFVYPTPFSFHFSAAHRDWARRDGADYAAKMRGADPDLAAHFAMVRKYGVTLWGKDKDQVFGPVPREAYLDSAWRDIVNAAEDMMENPVYVALNLCRTLALAREGAALSKKSGGEWALQNLPEGYRAPVRAALTAYETGGEMAAGEEAGRFADYMLGEIRGAMAKE